MGNFGMGNRKASKVTAVMVEEMRRAYEQGVTQRELGERYRLSVGQVGRIVRRESWQDTGVAKRFVERESWNALERGEVGERRLRGVPAEEEMMEESLERVKKMTEIDLGWGKNPFEGRGVKRTGGSGWGVSEEIKHHARRLMGMEDGEPEELGPVGVEELPVGNG